MRSAVAQSITDELFLKHPEWDVQAGEGGRQNCAADACLHVDSLAGAIEAGSPDVFGDYARWTARMLGSRGINAHTLGENFARLGKHLSERLLPEEHKTVEIFLARGREACMQIEPVSESQPLGGSLGDIREAFLAAILSGQRQASLKVIEDALSRGHGHVELYVDVFSEALRRVGVLWEMNKISVAQEHIATSITQYAVASIYPRLVTTAAHRGNMVVTGVSGELHQIGANLVADAMEANGWAVRFLGTNLPHSSILATIDEVSANVLCISHHDCR